MVAVQRVRRNNLSAGGSQSSISSEGSLLYVSGGNTLIAGRLQWVSRGGQEEGPPLDPEPQSYEWLYLSPDGRRLAAHVDSEDGFDIWVWDVERGTRTRLTFDRSSSRPIWTPDGARITFSNARRGISSKPADGSGPEEELVSPEGFAIMQPSSWSPDGSTLAFVGVVVGTSFDIWLFRPEGGRKPEPFLQTPSEEGGASFSPDGRWLAYHSNESGRSEVYVVSFPDRAGKWQVSTGGGRDPVWARSGRELFYHNRNQLLAAPVTTTPRFLVGRPQLLFEGPDLTLADSGYDASPDGRRFIVVKPVEAQAAAPSQIQIVLHWAEELKRRGEAAARGH
jgi:serine/threonine-protein kinase